jgi:hypothetical protein
MGGPPDAFACSASFKPSQASLPHSAARTRTEYSPMPAIKITAHPQ